MKKTKLILLSLLLTIAFVGSDSPQVVHAKTYLDTLYVWHSDISVISKWECSYFNISAVNMQVNGTGFYTYFIQGMLNAASEWSSVIGSYPIVSGYDSNTATFKVYGGTPTELATLNDFDSNDFSSGVYGVTKDIIEPSYLGDYRYYDGSSYTDICGQKKESVLSCVVNWTGVSENRVKCSCLHETGHALGWEGHSTGTSDVMTSSPTDLTSLTNSDKGHLSQVY